MKYVWSRLLTQMGLSPYLFITILWSNSRSNIPMLLYPLITVYEWLQQWQTLTMPSTGAGNQLRQNEQKFSALGCLA